MAETSDGESSRGLDRRITRRDFANGLLLGTGMSLLGAKASSAEARTAGNLLDENWTGPGGIGDYAHSNGNTAAVVNAAHSVRDGIWATLPSNVIDTREEYDLVVVGGGVSGLMSAFTFAKSGNKRVLILDNHPVFGGESKQNEFRVDGHHLYAPQGANGVSWPPQTALPKKALHPVWTEIGMPTTSAGIQWIKHVPGDTTARPYSTNNYDGMQISKFRTRLGYFYADPSAPSGHRWVVDPWLTAFRDAPWPQQAKDDLLAIEHFPEKLRRDDWREWLDSMTYKEFLEKVAGVRSPVVFDYIDPVVAVHGPGMGSDVISAYAAAEYGMPGVWSVVLANEPEERRTPGEDREFVSFPGGNSIIARRFVKTLIPDAIEGTGSLEDVLYGRINWSALDRAGRAVRLRLRSTVVFVAHDGPAERAKKVDIVYVVAGKPRRVRAKAVIMAGGQWINKYVLRDIPSALREAMNAFDHAPILVANVAVRNWKFIDKIGISAARWFEGFGFFTNVRAPLDMNGRHMPLDPDKPTVLTFYVPFTSGLSQSGMTVRNQVIAARTKLFATTFRDYELQIRTQLTRLFGDYGFDAARDIAGIVLNRWGHAFVVAPPGFYFGANGRKSNRDIIREGYGRVRFGHSELSGSQDWDTACQEGERAAQQAMHL